MTGTLFPVINLIPQSRPSLLDLVIQKFTIGRMILTPEERQVLYTPYLEILRDCRIQAGVSQAALAAAVDLSSKYVTLVEGARRTPAVESLLALMAEAGVRRSTADQMLQELLACFEWER